MFAALCDNTEFFRERMNLYIAIAPIVRIKNMNSKLLRKQSENILAYKAMKAMGHEQCYSAAAGNPLGVIFNNSPLGS